MLYANYTTSTNSKRHSADTFVMAFIYVLKASPSLLLSNSILQMFGTLNLPLIAKSTASNWAKLRHALSLHFNHEL